MAGDERQQWIWQKFPSDSYLPRQLRAGYDEYKALEVWRERATEFRSKREPNFCLDSLQQRHAGSPVSVFWCHGALGTQGFTFIEYDGTPRVTWNFTARHTPGVPTFSVVGTHRIRSSR